MRGQLGRLPPLSEVAATVRSRGPSGRASIRAADDVLEADLQSDEIVAKSEALRCSGAPVRAASRREGEKAQQAQQAQQALSLIHI